MEYDRRYRTSRSIPQVHTEAHVGKYFFIEDDWKNLYPEGMAGQFEDSFKLTGENGMLIRPTSWKLVQEIKSLEMPGQAPRRPAIMLTGERGCGKSGVLNYLTLHAQTSGWITISVPSCRRIIEDGIVCLPSRTQPGMFDQHDFALEIIQHTLARNESRLREMPQTGKYDRDKFLPEADDQAIHEEKEQIRADEVAEKRRLRASAEAKGEVWDASEFKSKYNFGPSDSQDRTGFTLADMLQWAIRNPPYATETLYAFFDELKRTTQFPVMIAIDEYNHLHHDNQVLTHAGSFVPTDQLSLVQLLRAYDRSGLRPEAQLARGVIVTAISATHTENFDKMRAASYIPPKFRTGVANMNRRELFSTLLHYASTDRFFMLPDADELDAHTTEYFRTLTNANPREVLRCALFT